MNAPNATRVAGGSLIVEAEELDVTREPRLIDVDPHHVGRSVDELVLEIQTEMKAVLLVYGSRCRFLGIDNGCTFNALVPTTALTCKRATNDARKHESLRVRHRRSESPGSTRPSDACFKETLFWK